MDFNTPNRPNTALKNVQRSAPPRPATPSTAKSNAGTPGVASTSTATTTNQQATATGDSGVSSAAKPPKRSGRGKRVFLWMLLVLVIAASCVGAFFACKYFAYQGVDTTRYQAVYLDNDNVYFGKVQYLVNGDMLLNDVFRVQAETDSKTTSGSTSAQATTGASADTSTSQQAAPEIRLIKPGKELHAPDDIMLINKDKVLFIENLASDGVVTKAINDFYEENDSAK